MMPMMKNAAHDVAEQTHDQRKCAGECFDHVERDHNDRRLGKSLQVTADAARANAEINNCKEHNQAERRVGLDVRRRRVDTRNQ